MKIYSLKSISIYTASIVTFCVAVQCLPGLHSVLYFEKNAVIHGELWRLVTGHFVHADNSHLLWNMLGLLVLGQLIEKYSARALFLSLAAGILFIDILLMSSFCSIDVYCGLSGVLNSLLVLALWFTWQQTGHWIVILTAGLCLVKIGAEILLGNSVFTQISWPPYPWAHLAGFVGGLLLVCWQSKTSTQQGFWAKANPA